MNEGAVTAELRQIYEDAWNEGIWVREFGQGDSGQWLVAAGWVADLELLEKRSGQEIKVGELGLGDVIEISVPALGSTREQSCREAIAELKRHGLRFVEEPEEGS